MKKKNFIILSAIIIVLAGIFFAILLSGTKPFRNLSVSEISNVTVELLPPGITFELDNSEIVELVKILHTVKVDKPDNSYTDYAGQAVTFTVTKADHSQITIQAYAPFLIINETGYKAKYESCETLSAFGNRITDK